MRNEVFQLIRENKRRFYNEINQLNSASDAEKKIPVSGKMKAKPQIAIPVLFDSFDQIRQINPFKKLQLSAVKSSFKNLRNSIGPACYPRIALLTAMRKKASSHFAKLRQRYFSKFSRMEDHILYFILVFFGEERAMELASPGNRNHWDNFTKFTVNRSLSFLIMFKHFENWHSTRIEKQSGPLSSFFKDGFNQGIFSKSMALGVVCNKLKNRFLRSINMFVGILQLVPLLNHLSFVKRL